MAIANKAARALETQVVIANLVAPVNKVNDAVADEFEWVAVGPRSVVIPACCMRNGKL